MPGLPGRPEGAVDLPGLQLVRHLQAFEALI